MKMNLNLKQFAIILPNLYIWTSQNYEICVNMCNVILMLNYYMDVYGLLARKMREDRTVKR